MNEIDRFETLFGPMFHYSDDEVIGRSLSRYGQWAIDEIALIAHILRHGPAGDFIDLGANIGSHTVAIAASFPATEIFSFEANARTFQLLAANVAGNGLPNVRLFNYLVGEQSAMSRVVTNEAEIHHNLGAIAFQVVPVDEPVGRLILQAAVDDVYPADRTVAFVKADLEGMELPALRGARATLTRCQPSIYFENGAQSNAGPLFDEMAALGYETFWHINFPFDRENFRGDADNIFGNAVEISTLCVHRDNKLIEAFRAVLTPTQKIMEEKAWYQCVELNARLRAEFRATMAPDAGVAWLRGELLRGNREPGGTVSAAIPPDNWTLPRFAAISRATLLDIPGPRLRQLLTPYVAAAPLDEAAYLTRHPDVADAAAAGQIGSAREHFVQVGYFEGRLH